MRIYLPAGIEDLSAPWLSARVAHAATPALAELLGEEDEEALELTALLAAADDALGLVARVPARLVVAADIPAGAGTPAGGQAAPSAISAPQVAWSDVVSLHVDDPDDAAAREIVAAAAASGAHRELAAELDLLWFDVTERDQLRALLSRD